jgi:hypothetical protein
MSTVNSLCRSAWDVASFEVRRSLSPQRVAVVLVLSLFPPAILTILILGDAGAWTEFVTCITCGMVCLLSLLLWATPNVYTELEGKGWTYVTSRPQGRLAMLLGKYLVAVGWGFLVSAVPACICVAIGGSRDTLGNPPWTSAAAILLCLFLAAIVYAAVFSLMGVIFYRRAMVVAASYVLVIEVFVAFVPSVLGKITVRYHLQGVCFNLLGWIVPFEEDLLENGLYQAAFGLYSNFIHIGALVVYAVIALGLAALIIRFREYVTSEEV